MKLSPHPHVPLEFGFLKTNFDDNLSSIQSISLPTMLNRALESITIFTPSCSTISSNFPGFVMYCKSYVSPEHPLFFTPILISFGSGCCSSPRKWLIALGVSDISALRGLSFLLTRFFATTGCVSCVSLLASLASSLPAFFGKEYVNHVFFPPDGALPATEFVPVFLVALSSTLNGHDGLDELTSSPFWDVCKNLLDLASDPCDKCLTETLGFSRQTLILVTICLCIISGTLVSL